MRRVLSAFLLFAACGERPADTKKEPPQSLPAPTLAPVSAPASVPHTAPTSKASVLLPLEPIVAEEYSAFLLNVETDEYAGRESFTVSHPDPAIQRRINVMVRSKTSAGGCYPYLMSTSIISFACLSGEKQQESSGPEERLYIPGGAYREATAYNFYLKDGALVPMMSEDLFEEYQRVYDIASRGSVADDRLTFDAGIGDYVILEDGISFYAEKTSQTTLETQILFHENRGLFVFRRWPLSTTLKMTAMPTLEGKSVREVVALFQQGVEMLSFDAALIPSEMFVYGTIVDGAHWRDASGENYLIVTERESRSKKDAAQVSRYVNMYQFRKAVPAPSTLPASAPTSAPTSVPSSVPSSAPASMPLEVITNVRSVFTKEEGCALTNRASFVKGSIVVTDLDLDGVGEVSFVSRLGCTELASPTAATVYLLESGGKYSLSGLPGSGEEPVAAGSFKSVSESFSVFLSRRWSELAL